MTRDGATIIDSRWLLPLLLLLVASPAAGTPTSPSAGKGSRAAQSDGPGRGKGEGARSRAKSVARTTLGTPQAKPDKSQAQAKSDQPRSKPRSDKPQAQTQNDKPQTQAKAQAKDDKPQAKDAKPQAKRSDKPQAQTQAKAKDDKPQAKRSAKPQAQAKGDRPQAQAKGDRPQAQAKSDLPQAQAKARDDKPQAKRSAKPQTQAKGARPQAKPAKGGPPRDAPVAEPAQPVDPLQLLARDLDRGQLGAARQRMAKAGLQPAGLQPALRLAYAELRLRQGGEEARTEAVALLGTLTGAGDAFGPLARVRLSEAAEQAGKLAEAVARLQELDRLPGGETQLRVTAVRRARLLRQLGQAEALASFAARLRPELSTSLPLAELTDHELWAARTLGRKDDADAALARLLREHPKSNEAQRQLAEMPLGQRLLHEIEFGWGSRGNKPRLDEVLTRLEAQPDELRPTLAGFDDFARAQYHLRDGAYPRAQQLFDGVIARADAAPVVLAQALHGRAVSLRRRNLDLEAAASYRLLAQRYPDDPLARRALEEAVRLDRISGEDGLAQLDVAQLLQRRGVEPRQQAWARWTEAWLALRAGHHGRAAELLAALRQDHPRAFGYTRGRLEEQALYWEGCARAEDGQVPAALELWSDLVTRFPLTYYSYLAFARLAALAPEQAARLRRPPLQLDDSMPTASAVPLVPRPETAAAVALQQAGLQQLAERELRTALRARRLLPDEVDHLAALQRDEGDESGAYLTERFYGQFDGYPEPGRVARWQISHPRPFADLVEKYAKAEEIDPLLVWAVMRQESAFQPRAKSWAGAVGLMQMMPATAQGLARAVGRRSISEAELLDPELNVRLSCRLLRLLLRQYDGNLMLTLAAYNAGPGNVRKWLGRWGELESDRFAEEIPIAEAHGYAKQVIEALGVYQHLYGSPVEGYAPMLRLSWAPPVAAHPMASTRTLASR